MKYVKIKRISDEQKRVVEMRVLSIYSVILFYLSLIQILSMKVQNLVATETILQTTKLEGNVKLDSDIKLQDSTTTLSLNLSCKLDKNILLNDGTIFLEKDLNFVGNHDVIGPGKVNGNGCTIKIKGQISETSELQTRSKQKKVGGLCNKPIDFKNNTIVKLEKDVTLTSFWTFQGTETILDGNNRILLLGDDANIIIKPSSQLLICNVIIQNISGTKIRCYDNSGSIIFQNVLWHQNGNYNFEKGLFNVRSLFDLFGKHIFFYKSSQESQITNYSSMIIHRGTTFCYSPPTSNQQLFTFEDASSKLHLKEATLDTKMPGLTLTKGTMVIEDKCNLSSEITLENRTITAGGITFGNDNAEDDFNCHLTYGSKLNIASGGIIYKNFSTANTFQINNIYTSIQLNPNTVLQLDRSLDIDSGRFRRSIRGLLIKKNNSKLIGCTEVIP